MKNLNNWMEIPFIDDFGDVEGIDHLGYLGECVKYHDPSEGTYYSENECYIYFNVDKSMVGIFFYQEDKISATKSKHWTFHPEAEYIIKVKRQDNSVLEFPMSNQYNGKFYFNRGSDFYKLLTQNPTGEKLKLAKIYKGRVIHNYVVQSISNR